MLNRMLMVMQRTSDHFRYFHYAVCSYKLVSYYLIPQYLRYQLAREILPNGPVGVAMAKVAINKGSEVSLLLYVQWTLSMNNSSQSKVSLINVYF